MNTCWAELQLPKAWPLTQLGRAGCQTAFAPPIARTRRGILLAIAGGDSRPAPPPLGRPPRPRHRRRFRLWRSSR